MKVDALLAIGLAACAGGLAWAAPWETGAAAALVLVLFARRGSPVLAVVCALAFFVTAWRAQHVVWRYEHARVRVSGRCVVRGEVARSPVMQGDAMRVDVDVGESTCAFRGLVTLHVPEGPALARGDRVEAITRLAPGYRFWNEELGDPRAPSARRGVILSGGAEDVVVLRRGYGVGAFVDRLRTRLRGRILATFPPGTSPMARALVLGEDDLQAPDSRAFRRSGLAHLLAVSGMHLVLVVATTVAALRALLVRWPLVAASGIAPMRVAAAIGIPLAWIYADLAGGSGSAIRAAWMSSVALGAHVLSRKPDTWRAFGLSIAGMAVFDPLVGFDYSFMLSAAATLGLLGLGRPIAEWLGARLPKALGFVVRAMSASLAASIACAPVLACMTGDLPVAGLVANLIAVPLGELAALPLCLLHALLEPVASAERGCAIAASGALAGVRAVARIFAAMPWGAAPVPTPTAGQLAAFAVAACAPLIARRPRRVVAAAFTIVIALEVRARAAPRGVLRATFLDVGQGDSAIVDLPDGGALVIDAGGLVGSPVDTGERVLAPVLRARRRKEIAAAVLSHPHPDHFGGFRAGLAAARVASLWDTGQGEAEGTGGEYAALLASMRARGTEVIGPASLCGAHQIGGARVEVLAPCPGPNPDRGPNDNSFVIRISYGTRSFLFMGDAEHEAEGDLLRRGGLRSDVLKVGHHGSRTSTAPAFLAAVDPEIAVISCGVRNRFGHPAAITLDTLGHARARLYRTDLDGAVTITTDGTSLEAHAAAD